MIIVVFGSVGLAAIYSVDLSRGENLSFFPTQAMAMGIGLIVFFIASFIRVTFYRAASRLVYSIALLLLVAVLLFGETVHGTTGWFRISGFSFQPAEFAKLALILFLAWWISKQGRNFTSPKFIIGTGIFTLLLVILILLQPDFGSTLILCGIWFGLLLLTGTKKRYIILLVSIVVVSFLISWLFLFKDYQKERFSTFLHPSYDPLGAGYNVSQSIIAVGSGKILGRGLGFGSQSQLHFLPEAQTDFISAVIAEELGFIGISIVLALYFLLIWRLLCIASNGRDDFGVYTVLGILLLFFLQVLVNIGGALGLMPLTGVTLPFLSYGGSSLIINFLLLGIVESVFRSNPSLKEGV